MKQYAALDDIIYFWFAGNDTSGSGGDGASPAADVRLAGAAADAAPVYSPTPVVLSHAGYPAGAYEIAITASAANGFAATNTYAVFCTLAIDSQNPTGFVGSFDLKPVDANTIQYLDSAAEVVPDANITHIHGNAITETVDGYLAAAFVKLFDVATPVLVASDVMRGTDNAAPSATALSDAVWTNAKAAFVDASIQTVDTVVDGIQTDLSNATDGLGALKALIDTVDGIVDAILLDTGTNGVLLAATATSAQLVDDVWDEVLSGATHNITDSAGKRLREMFDAGLYEEATAQGGNTNTITLAATASAIDDFYNMMTLTIIGGTGVGQMRTFKDYVGSTKVATACTAWSVTPDSTSKYVIVSSACVGVFDLGTDALAQINAEVVDVIRTDTMAEMAQGAPPASPTLAEAMNYLYRDFRNKSETTASEHAVYNDAGAVKIVKATLADNGTTMTKGEYGTGA